MEKKHKLILAENFKEEIAEKETIILNIPDDYQYMDEELIAEIETKVGSYFYA